MKIKYYLFSSMVLFGWSFLIANCNNTTLPDQMLKEKENVLKMAEVLAFSRYGNSIKNELPLTARLVKDSVWIIQGTLLEGAEGGTVYIELSKGEHRLLKITHHK